MNNCRSKGHSTEKMPEDQEETMENFTLIYRREIFQGESGESENCNLDDNGQSERGNEPVKKNG